MATTLALFLAINMVDGNEWRQAKLVLDWKHEFGKSWISGDDEWIHDWQSALVRRSLGDIPLVSPVGVDIPLVSSTSAIRPG